MVVTVSDDVSDEYEGGTTTPWCRLGATRPMVSARSSSTMLQGFAVVPTRARGRIAARPYEGAAIRSKRSEREPVEGARNLGRRATADPVLDCLTRPSPLSVNDPVAHGTTNLGAHR